MTEEWSGKDLPPVGCECEANDRITAYGAKSQFRPCRIVHKTAKGVLLFEFECGNFGYSAAPADFRPRRTPRQWAVDAIAREIDGGMSPAHNALTVFDAIARGSIPGVALTD